MRKVLILLIGLLIAVSCQKDFYLEDLNDANANIAQLQSINEALSAELKDAIAQGDATALLLADAEATIVGLNESILDLNIDNDELNATIEGLTSEIASINSEIALLISERDSLLGQAELDVAKIEELNAEIAELEAREPEVIIEYITVVETVIEYVTTSTGLTQADIDAATAPLLAEIATLKQQLADATSTEVVEEGDDDAGDDDDADVVDPVITYGDWSPALTADNFLSYIDGFTQTRDILADGEATGDSESRDITVEDDDISAERDEATWGDQNGDEDALDIVFYTDIRYDFKLDDGSTLTSYRYTNVETTTDVAPGLMWVQDGITYTYGNVSIVHSGGGIGVISLNGVSVGNHLGTLSEVQARAEELYAFVDDFEDNSEYTGTLSYESGGVLENVVLAIQNADGFLILGSSDGGFAISWDSQPDGLLDALGGSFQSLEAALWHLFNS